MKNGELYHSQLRLWFKLMKKTIIELSLGVAMIIFMNFSLADGYIQDTNPFREGYVQDKSLFEENLK